MDVYHSINQFVSNIYFLLLIGNVVTTNTVEQLSKGKYIHTRYIVLHGYTGL